MGNYQPGQTSYYVWLDPWGQLQLDNTQTWNFINSGIKVQGGGSFGGTVQSNFGLVAGSDAASSGSFGTKYTFGNATTPPVYIATEYAIGNTNNHLAVTTHAESRTPVAAEAYAAPDGTLDMANANISGTLTVGSCVGCGGNPPGGSSGALQYNNGGSFGGSITTFNTNPGHNDTINFHDFYGADALELFNSGTGNVYGWGLNAGEMQFFVQDATSTHFSFNAAPGGLQPDGTNEFARLTPRTSGGGWTLASGELFGWSNTSTSANSTDTGFSRESAGVVDLGNGTAGDTSGTLKAAIVSASTLLRTASYTVGTLPSASSAGAGAIVRVSDASSCSTGSIPGPLLLR